MDNLKEIFRKQLLSEMLITEVINIPDDKELEKCPVFFPRTKATINDILDGGFAREYFTCQAYGDGIYGALYLSDALGRISRGYGRTIIETRVLCKPQDLIVFGGRGYMDAAQRDLLGRNVSLYDQLRTKIKDEAVLRDLSRYTNCNDTFQQQIKKYGFKGCVYDYGCPVMLPEDYKICIPYRYSTDEGRTWTKCLTPEVRERLSHISDTGFNLSSMFDEIYGNGIYVPAIDRQFVVVANDITKRIHGKNDNNAFAQKGRYHFYGNTVNHNLRYNIVDVDNKTTVFPDWILDEQPTSVSPKGTFQFEYKGRTLNGNVINDADGTPQYQPIFFYEDQEDPENTGWYPIEMVKEAYDDEPQDYRAVNESLFEDGQRQSGNKYELKSMNDMTSAVSLSDGHRWGHGELAHNNIVLYRCCWASQMDSIFDLGNLRQFGSSNDGTWCGDGVYTIWDERILRPSHDYGNTMMASVLIGGFDRFLIFDDAIAENVYGPRHTIYDQLKRLVPQEEFEGFWKRISYYISKYSNGSDADNHMHGRTVGLLHHMFRRYISWEEAQRLNGGNSEGYVKTGGYHDANPDYFQKKFAQFNIRGAVYNGNKDRHSVVVYNYNELIPYAFKTNVNGQWNTSKFDLTKAIERQYMNNDPRQKFGHMYKFVEDPPTRVEYDGKIFGYSAVQKNNGKWNFLNTNTGEELSPEDFDSQPTRISPKGTFSFEYGRVDWKGRIVDGETYSPAFYYVDNEDPENTGWYPFDVLRDAIDTGEDSAQEEMLQEAIREILNKKLRNL